VVGVGRGKPDQRDDVLVIGVQAQADGAAGQVGGGGGLVGEEDVDEHAPGPVQVCQVAALGRTFAAELAPRSIRVNTVSPGISPKDRDEAAREQLALIPLRRLGRPDEIATTILFLASNDASFYTGADFTPDGGTRDV
jgi:Enoyl-(Acyl carrier protein) reductase